MEKLGRYNIIRVLGKGAMGMVYEARDPNLDRRVAIKTIKVDNLPEAAIVEYEARFRTEARSAARLQHPNIVSVYDSERHGDTAYLVMEFVQGEDLKQHLDSGKRYTLEESLAILRDLLAALDYAHQQNIVHRDVKPANLLVEASGRVKLTDFGVARIQDSGEATRTKGSMVGTLKYMAPEQVQGLPIDARADLFSAGVVLYQLLTGKRPFDGDSEFAIIHQIISQQPPPPSSINAQLPAALDAVVARALAKDRAQRFTTAREFALALLDASGQALDATAVPPASAPAGTGGSLGTGSLGSGSRGNGSTARLARSAEDSGSVVTQELELVYWKDVKDSDDPFDLEGFLNRFPSGIYADLARRRLKKLGDLSRGEHSGTMPARAQGVDAGGHDDATQQMAYAQAPQRSSSAGVDRLPTPTPTAALPGAAQSPVAAMATADAAAIPGVTVHPPPKRAKTPMLALAAAVLVAVLAGVGFNMSGEPSAAPQAVPVVVAPTPADTPPVSAAPALEKPAPTATAVTPETKVAPPPTNMSTVRAAPAPEKPAPAAAVITSTTKLPGTKPAVSTDKAVAGVPAVSAKAETTPTAAAQSLAPIAAKPPAATAVIPMGAPNGPEQACAGRVLLGFQACLNEQCANAAFAGHPVCVKRNAAEKLRLESKGTDR